MSASQSSPQPAPGRGAQPRSPKLAAEPATLRGGLHQAAPRVPKKRIPPPGYDPTRDTMDIAGQAYELDLHLDTFRKQIKNGVHPPFFVNADGSLRFSRKLTDIWKKERTCSNLLEAAKIQRDDAKVRAARRKEVGNG